MNYIKDKECLPSIIYSAIASIAKMFATFSVFGVMMIPLSTLYNALMKTKNVPNVLRDTTLIFECHDCTHLHLNMF